MLNQNKTINVVDSRMMKIVSAKKADLKDAVVLIRIKSEDQIDSDTLDKYGKFVDLLNSIEPSGCYFLLISDNLSHLDMRVYNKSDFKNANLLVTINPDEDVDSSALEDDIKTALSSAKSVEFIYGDINIEEH